MKTALRPDLFFKNLPSVQNDKEAEKNGASEEERQLYAMYQTRGWKLIEETMNDLSTELNELNTAAISSGASLEDIGRNAIVVNLTQGIITKLLSKVHDAVDACQIEVEEDEQ